MLASIWRRLIAAFQRHRLASDLDEEIRGHYDALCREFEDEGCSPAEAARRARLRLGGLTQTRESSRDEWHFRMLDALARDTRLALRSLGRRPGFLAAAVATLALGIGASTAIFSVAYGVALRPLPYPDADRLVRIYEANPATNQYEHDVSVGAFEAWRRDGRSFESMALFDKTSARTVAGSRDERVITMRVSPAFFDVLGVPLIVGRGFKPESEYTRFTTTDVVLSYGAWQRLLGGRANPLGSTVTLRGVGDDDTFTVVGVLTQDFAFTEPVDLWMPEVIEPEFAPRLRGWRYDRVVGRLKQGVTAPQAEAELAVTAARLAVETPAVSAGWTVTVKSMHASVIGAFAGATSLMLAAVAVVLLVACLNVGGLFVARAIARDHETAVRISLGAGPWRLVQLRFVEALVVCLAGTGVGVLLAVLGVSALKAAAPPGIPRLDAIAIDSPVLTMSLVSMIVAAIAFTVAPLGRFARGRLAGVLQVRSDAGATANRPAIRTALTVAQCAGAATLVVLGVMLTRSFDRLTRSDLGWTADRTVAIAASPTTPRDLRRPWFARVVWSDALIDTLGPTAGVAHVALTTQLPFSPASIPSTIARGRKGASSGARWTTLQHKVTDRYFELMGIRLISGRSFGRDDRFTEGQMNYSEQRPERGVAIITEHTAATLWPGELAIGRELWLPDNDSVSSREVIGIVSDIQFASVGEPPGLHVFVPWTQDSASARIYVLVKSDAEMSPAALRDLVRGVPPGADVDQIVSLTSLIDHATAQPRFTSRVVSAFGLLSLLLAAVGIYGTLSYIVGSRTRELGVRVALGASRVHVFRHVLTRGLVPAVAGGVVGLAVALTLARAFRALLFAIDPVDAASLATGAAALLLAAAGAAVAPAARAARVDPVRALRME